MFAAKNRAKESRIPIFSCRYALATSDSEANVVVFMQGGSLFSGGFLLYGKYDGWHDGEGQIWNKRGNIFFF